MFRWAVPLRGAVTRVRGKNVEGTGRGGRAYLQYSKRSDDSVPESHPRPFRQMLDVPLTWSVHGPPTRLCRPLFKMAEVPRVQGREVLSMIFFFFFFFFRNLSIFEFWRGFRWR